MRQPTKHRKYFPSKSINTNSKPLTPHFTDFAEELLQDPPICASDLPQNKFINRGDLKNMNIDKTREEDFL